MDSRTRVGMAVLVAAAIAVLAIGVGSVNAQTKRAQSAATQRQIERGKYLVAIMSCNDCHTPFKMGPKGPEPDMTKMLMGHPESMKLPPVPALQMPWLFVVSATDTAFAGPWGISYAANLTSDKNTGIGSVWTEDLFIKAMRTGKHLGTSRPIQPPMPWEWIGKATDEDLKAIFAYMKSVPPIVNHVPDWQEPPAASPAGAAAQPKAGTTPRR